MEHPTAIVAAVLLVSAGAAFAEDAKPAALVVAPITGGEFILNFKQHYDIGFWGVCSNGSGMVRPVTARKMARAASPSIA